MNFERRNITIRFRAEELKLLEEVAAHLGSTTSGYVRRVVREALKAEGELPLPLQERAASILTRTLEVV